MNQKVDIEVRVLQILGENFGIERTELIPQANLRDDLNLDSLDAVEIMMLFEEEFDITIPDEDAEKLKTVGDILNYIRKVKPE
jgi:acyl carrier protein